MPLVFLIGLDIKPDPDGIAGKGPDEDGGILCGVTDSFIFV